MMYKTEFSLLGNIVVRTQHFVFIVTLLIKASEPALTQDELREKYGQGIEKKNYSKLHFEFTVKNPPFQLALYSMTRKAVIVPVMTKLRLAILNSMHKRMTP